jgi:two-component system, NarL family, response regulator NreC
MTISILLADDHIIVLEGVRSLLENEPDFQVIGEASSGAEAIEKTAKLKPNVLVLDLGMPDIHGKEIVRQIHENHPRINIVILSMHSKEAYVADALSNGAIGYVLKGSKSEDLVQAIRLAVKGIRYLSPPLDDKALEIYTQKTKAQPIDLYETLTNRERQILYLASCGHSNNSIARHLSISPRTVEVHRAKVMSKLGLHNHAELVLFSVQHGIITVETSEAL